MSKFYINELSYFFLILNGFAITSFAQFSQKSESLAIDTADQPNNNFSSNIETKTFADKRVNLIVNEAHQTILFRADHFQDFVQTHATIYFKKGELEKAKREVYRLADNLAKYKSVN